MLLISSGRPHFFQKMGCYDPLHFSIAWDIIALEVLHDDMFTLDLMRGLLFSAARCNIERESSGEFEAVPDVSYVRSCLMNYLLKAPLIIPKAYIFPLYVLLREQLEYKFLSMQYNIEEKCGDMFPSAKSYHCDICGFDLCNAYLAAKQKQDDILCSTFCSLCIRKAIEDKNFMQNKRKILKDVLRGQYHHIHPESSLTIIYRYMDIDNLMSACGLDLGGTTEESNLYLSCYESLRYVEKFPTESLAKQYVEVSSVNVLHGKGLIAIRDIPGNTFIAEYKGEIKPRHDIEQGNIFCADLSDDKVIDPYRSDCLAKYANHSCRPNATLTASASKHIFLVSLEETILAGTEITVDYGDNRLYFFEQCLCHSCKITS